MQKTKLLTMAALLTAIVGCVFQSSQVTVQDPAEVEEIAQIRIPPSAKGLHCEYDTGGMDPMAYGRFEIPAADLPTVLEGMGKGDRVRPYEGYSNVTVHKMDETWWQPDELKSPQVAEWTSSSGFVVNLIFGETAEPGTLTVYFFNFST